MVEEAERAKATAASPEAARTAVGDVLCATLQDVQDPGDLLEPVEDEQAVNGAARLRFHTLVTGQVIKSSRKKLCATNDDAPWPSERPGPPDGYAIYRTGLGSDGVEKSLAKGLRKDAALATALRFHCRLPPLVLFKPTNGPKSANRLHLLMCAASPPSPALGPTRAIRHALSAASFFPSQAQDRRLGGHPRSGEGRPRRS